MADLGLGLQSILPSTFEATSHHQQTCNNDYGFVIVEAPINSQSSARIGANWRDIPSDVLMIVKPS